MTKKPLYVPALRGHFGDWIYYSCLMPLRELAVRVEFAEDLHKNKRLSELIQRELKRGRSRAIAKYLRTQKERFFNSLVVAVYGGDPSWHEFGNITPQRPDIKMSDIPEAVRQSVGFLSFSGEERLFAVDGQHRLAGIKKVAPESDALGDEEASIVLVGHKKTAEGMRRSRRLFTVLNKTAAAVSKGEIIALDEDDVMAICVRRLVEDNPEFSGERISYRPTSNLPPTDLASLTTIGNLYDVLKTVFSRLMGKRSADLRFFRPDDKDLDNYYEFACNYFRLMRKHFPPLGDYFAAADFARIAKKHRGPFGGHLLFRPIGLRAVTEAVTTLAKKHGLEAAVKMVARVPMGLHQAPSLAIVWNAKQRKIIGSGRALLTRLILYMVGYPIDAEKLARDYGKALGEPTRGAELLARLPRS